MVVAWFDNESNAYNLNLYGSNTYPSLLLFKSKISITTGSSELRFNLSYYGWTFPDLLTLIVFSPLFVH